MTIDAIFTYVLDIIRLSTDSLIGNEREIGNSNNPSTVILAGIKKARINNPEHIQFLEHLFSYHPNSEVKLSNLESIHVNSNFTNNQKTVCFFLRKKDGNIDDISYLKCISHLGNLHKTKNLTQMEDRFDKINLHLIEFFCKVMHRFPLCVSDVLSSLLNKFPHKRHDIHSQFLYTKSMFTLAEVYIYIYIYI